MTVLGNLALVLFVAWIFGKVVERFSLPSLVGMLIAGICLGPYGLGLISEGLLALAPVFRTFALVIILLRAGLALARSDLKEIKGSAFNLSVIPCLFEGFTVMVVAHLVLGLSWFEGGILGFTLAAVSPAVVVPSMLDLQAEGYGRKKQIPSLVLVGASVDDVFAITLFGSFLVLARGDTAGVWLTLAQLPWSIVAGIASGLILGLLLVLLFRRFPLAGTETLLFTVVASILLLEAGEHWGFAGLLGIMVLGMVLRENGPSTARRLASQLSGIWTIAQLTLFAFVGLQVNLAVAKDAGALGLVIVILGLLGRSLGVWFSLLATNLNHKERLFCMIAYVPKATVQAAIGGIPLAMGLASGELVLAVSALAILVTAPLGAIGIKKSAPYLLDKYVD